MLRSTCASSQCCTEAFVVFQQAQRLKLVAGWAAKIWLVVCLAGAEALAAWVRNPALAASASVAGARCALASVCGSADVAMHATQAAQVIADSGTPGRSVLLNSLLERVQLVCTEYQPSTAPLCSLLEWAAALTAQQHCTVTAGAGQHLSSLGARVRLMRTRITSLAYICCRPLCCLGLCRFTFPSCKMRSTVCCFHAHVHCCAKCSACCAGTG